MRRPLKPGVFGHAQFEHSADAFPIARLRLDRWWDSTLRLDEYGRPDDDRYRPLVIIGKNPSDAGSDSDDPTSSDCTTFARREGANGLVIVNIHPGISETPSALSRMLLPVGWEDRNMDAVRAALQLRAVAIVAAWGEPPPKLPSHRDRVDRVKKIARDLGVSLVCFGTNKGGSPRHPQYLKATTPLVPYWSAAR
jgi:hypothetical protein